MNEALARAGQHDRMRIVAALAARTRDLDVAEDALQEAFAEAAVVWPIAGLPDRPSAWLYSVAWRRAIDMLRKRSRHDALLASRGAEQTAYDDTNEPSGDDAVALLLVCCHPALDTFSRIALTLRHVAGLRPREIAAAFLSNEAAVVKRLTRARKKLRASGIRFEMPDATRIDDRMDDVRDIVMLIFNEGYLSHDEGPPLRDDLRAHAIWLARTMCELRRTDGETHALLALLLFHEARSKARYREGRLIPFDQQNRALWNKHLLDEARSLLRNASGQPALGRFALLAAIAALQTAVPPLSDVWAGVAGLYEILARVAPSKIITINYAYALGRAGSLQAGLAILRPLLADKSLADYAPLFAATADLLERSHDEGAAEIWERAARSLPPGAQQRALLDARAALGML